MRRGGVRRGWLAAAVAAVALAGGHAVVAGPQGELRVAAVLELPLRGGSAEGAAAAAPEDDPGGLFGPPRAGVAVGDALPSRPGEELLLLWPDGRVEVHGVARGGGGRGARLVRAGAGRLELPARGRSWTFADVGRSGRGAATVAAVTLTEGEATATLASYAFATGEEGGAARLECVGRETIALARRAALGGIEEVRWADVLADFDGDGVAEVIVPATPPSVWRRGGRDAGLAPLALPWPEPARDVMLTVGGGGGALQDGRDERVWGGLSEFPSPGEGAATGATFDWRSREAHPTLMLGERNGDGVADLMFVSRAAPGRRGAWREVVALHRSAGRTADGEPTWSSEPLWLELPDSAGMADVYDLDGDDLPDLVTIESNLDVTAPRTRVVVHLGADQARSETAGGGARLAYRTPSQVIRSRDAVGLAVVRDFDGDGAADLALSNLAYVFGSVSDFAEAVLAEEVTMGLRFHAGEAGRFAEAPFAEVEYAVRLGTFGGSGWFAVGGDYDGDGREDLVVTTGPGRLGVVRPGAGSGGRATPGPTLEGLRGYLVAADLEGRGRSSLVAVDAAGGMARVVVFE